MLLKANQPNWALLGVFVLLLSITHALSSAVPTQQIHASVNDFVEGTSYSQNLVSNISFSCSQGMAYGASIELGDVRDGCPRPCQITERLPKCALDKPNSVVRLMELAKQQNAWVNKESPPTDTSCRDTAVQLTQGPYPFGAYASFKSNPLPNLSNVNFTISSRFRLFPGHSQKDILLSVTSNKSVRYLVLYFRHAYGYVLKRRFFLFTYAGGKLQNVFLDNVPVFDGNYHNFVLQVFNTRGTSRMAVFVDGTLIGSVTLPAPMTWDQNALLQIGRRTYARPTQKPFNFNGVIDDIIVQPRIWSTEEINCMSAVNCGEMLEKPANTMGITVTSAEGGRVLDLGPDHKSVALYKDVIQSVRYRYISSITRNSNRTVKFVVACQASMQHGAIQNVESFHIVHIITNVPPSVFLSANSANKTYIYDQASSLHLIANDIVVRDSDSANLQSAVVYLSNNSPGSLSIDSTAASVSISSAFSNSNRNITLRAEQASGASLSSFNAILRMIQYTVPADTKPSDPPILVTFIVTDVPGTPGALPASGTGTVTVGIKTIENRAPPIISGLQNVSLPWTRIAALASNAIVSDKDAIKNVEKITVQLTSRPIPRTSPVTGLSCERFNSLLTRTDQCKSSNAPVLDLLCYARQIALNSPIVLNTNPRVGGGCSAGFDALNFYLDIPKTTLDLTGKDVSTFTLSAWFNVFDAFGYILALTAPLSKDRTSVDLISLHYDTLKKYMLLRAGINTYGVVFPSIGDLSRHDWHHVMVTVRNSNVTLYLNGTLRGHGMIRPYVNQRPSYIVPSVYQFHIGARPSYIQGSGFSDKMGGNLTGLQLWFDSEPGNVAACIKNHCPASIEVQQSNKVAVTYDDAPPRLELRGTGAGISDFQDVLRTLKYNGQGSVPGKRVFNYSIQDEAYQTTTAKQVLSG